MVFRGFFKFDILWVDENSMIFIVGFWELGCIDKLDDVKRLFMWRLLV